MAKTDPVSAWTTRRVVRVGLDEPLWVVRDLMLAHGIHHVVVVAGGRLVGVVSDRDVLAAVSPLARNDKLATERDLRTLERRVHQLMSRRLVTIRDDASMVDAVEAMLEHAIHCLPVLDPRGGCSGVLTTTDVLRWSIAAEPAAPEALARP